MSIKGDMRIYFIAIKLSSLEKNYISSTALEVQIFVFLWKLNYIRYESFPFNYY